MTIQILIVRTILYFNFNNRFVDAAINPSAAQFLPSEDSSSHSHSFITHKLRTSFINMFHSTIRNAGRRMASKVRFSSSYKEKSFKENWLMDSGAYPIMGVIAVAVVLPIVAGMKQWREPDNRFFSSNRKQIFRGELAEQYTHASK